jgi:uncharacterized protein (TIGR00297 family)
MVAAAIGINIVFAAAAYKRKSVSKSGGLAGAVVGTGIWLAGGLLFWGLLVFFFVSSSLFSRFGELKKKRLAKIQEKGGRRDAVQVGANAGTAFICALLYGATYQMVFMCMFSAALAAATADTWASEIGVLSRRRPVSITTGKRVETGISGGITLLGTSAAFIGALFAAAVFSLAALADNPNHPAFKSLLVITMAGFGASLIDSLLGSTVQIHYIDHQSGIITERRILEGRTLPRYQGVAWINNDTVNALSSLFAALTAGLLYQALC